MEPKQQHTFQSPAPNISLLRDISNNNFKTPKHPSLTHPNISLFTTPYSQQFFTASKDTPRSTSSSSTSFRPRPDPTTIARRKSSKVVRKLKAFELEQSKSARKAQIHKQNSLKMLSKSLTVWLNFLLQNPSSCGVNVLKFTGENDPACDSNNLLGCVSGNKKRESGPRGGVGVDGLWRGPKRHRGLMWSNVAVAVAADDDNMKLFSDSKFLALRISLKEVCSFEDLRERMRVYLSLSSCKEIFDVMTQVTKNVDEGRLKMKAHCPTVTDVGMKEKAMRILMCYNPIWLRIGFFIIFGGDSLLPNGDVNTEQEISFLKMVIEKQFFSHVGLAKAYAYNKMVEGLYRPGYFEKLGNVILKRFLLLVLVLDRAKCQSSLPIKYGIDGLDGGSPLLFTLQSNIKSSRQVINDFLSTDVMHGEGNLLAHLVIVGYKLSYQQGPLVEYDFRVTDLFQDLQDGVRLCRAIQLLQHDSSILMKMIIQSDTRKKKLVNCGIALQYLKQAGVPLYDEDGTEIMGEDVVNGDKELILSLLWNMFVHLQLPLLMNRTLLSEEISTIRGVRGEYSSTCTLLDMLLSWIQAICENYDFMVENFAQLVDGKAMWCLLDYYFRKEYHCSCSKDLNETNGEASIMLAADYTDAVHNFILSQKLTTLLGNFPEFLQISDILEHSGACNDQSVVILLVFLSFQLLVKRNMDQLNFHKLLGFDCQSPDRKRSSTERCFMHSPAVLSREELHGNSTEDSLKNFKSIMAWWQEMAQQNSKCIIKPETPPMQFISTGRWRTDVQRESAATIIQSHFRRLREQHKYLQMKNAVSVLQTVIQASLRKKKLDINKFNTIKAQELAFDRSSIIIQSHVRGWFGRRVAHRHRSHINMIQSHCRGWLMRRKLSLQRAAATRIQRSFRCLYCQKEFLCYSRAATEIQRFVRGQITRKRLLGDVTTGYVSNYSSDCSQSIELKIFLQAVLKLQRWWRGILLLESRTNSAVVIQSHIRGWVARREAMSKKHCVVVIQCHCRGLFIRRNLSFQRAAVLKIQSAFRCMKCRNKFLCYRHSATEIQRFVRGCITRKWLLGASHLQGDVPGGYVSNYSSDCSQSIELNIFLQAVLKLQRWWRGILLESRTNSAVVIQSHIRGWIARREAMSEKHCVIVIQSHCRGLLIRRTLSFQRDAVLRIQSAFRCMKCQKKFRCYRHSATEIQRFVRGCITRKWLLGDVTAGYISKNLSGCSQNLELNIYFQAVLKLQRWWRGVLLLKSRTNSAIVIQSNIRGWMARRRAIRERDHIFVIQSHFHDWLIRRNLSFQIQAVIRIQSAFRYMKCQKAFLSHRHAAMEIQRFVRGRLTRKWLLGSSYRGEALASGHISSNCLQHVEMKLFLLSVLKLQRWWRCILLFKSKTTSAVVIQSHVRGWIARRALVRERHHIVVIQSFWKGYLARKASQEQLLDLRLRVQKSAANVDDGMRIINRLIAALSELLSMKSISGILHTCATLDIATKHSQRCCETLVAAGAVDTLLKLIRSVSRSIPDQEILKHALSTLRNLARYPHLTAVLIDRRGSVQTIFWELLRNKDEGYFIASELLKRICLDQDGVEAVRNLPALVKRLCSHVEDLARKAGIERRNARCIVAREQTERRLSEAIKLLKLIEDG